MTLKNDCDDGNKVVYDEDEERNDFDELVRRRMM
jgi:hypothetical protein